MDFANALRDCLVSGVVLIDGDSSIATLTPEAEQMLGLHAGPERPLPLSILPAPLADIVREHSLSGQPAAGRQLNLTVAGRGAVTLGLTAVPLPPSAGALGSALCRDAATDGPLSAKSGVVLVLHDLTPLKQLDQKMWRLDRLASIGTLSASMAHEIKNALVAGRTFIDLLLEKHKDAELVDIVRREMGRIDAIVSRMLKFVGPARSSFSAVHLHESLDHSLRLVQPQLDSKTITLNRLFHAAPELVQGDDYELQQAFVNLFLNALEAMAPNGTLTVATDIVSPATPPGHRAPSAESQLRVTVKDTGAGIAAKDIDRLFEPFFTTKPTGTGLGLPITQRIIHEHHGAITVESQPGQGTTFNILLPPLNQPQ